MTNKLKQDGGYSLIEIMVTVLILAVLVLIAVATYTYTITTTRRVTCEANRHLLDTAAAVYQGANDAPPTEIDDLAPYVTNLESAKICPGDNTTELRYDDGLNRVVCDYHE